MCTSYKRIRPCVQKILFIIINNNFPVGKWCAPVLDGRYNKSMRRYVGAENGVDGSARFDPVRKYNHGKWMFIRRIRVHHDGNVWFPCFAHTTPGCNIQFYAEWIIQHLSVYLPNAHEMIRLPKKGVNPRTIA